MKPFSSYSKTYSEELAAWGIPLMEKADGKQRHTLTATVWNKSFVDSSGTVWSPVGQPEMVPSTTPLPPHAVAINKPNKAKTHVINLTLQNDAGSTIVVSKYLSSDEGGITNTEFKDKFGLKRSRESFKMTTKKIVAGAPTVSLDIGRPGASVVEQFYAFQDVDSMIDLITKNLEKELPNSNIVSAVNSFLKRGCDHMNWPSDTPETLKVAIAQLLSETIIGICLLKNTGFNLHGTPPFTDVADTFYLPVKDALPTIDFMIKMRSGNLLKFSSKMQEGAAAAFGPRLIWAAVKSDPNSYIHKGTHRMMQGTEIGTFTDILKRRGGKVKETAYEYAFSLIGMSDPDKWVKTTASQRCDLNMVPMSDRQDLIDKLTKYVKANGRSFLVNNNYTKALLGGNVCALSMVVRFVIADAINNDPKSQKPMMSVLRMFDYHQLHLDKNAFMKTGTIKFALKSFTGGTSKVSGIEIDPGKGSLADTSGAYGFLNFRLK
jgi:hypothetical protein